MPIMWFRIIFESIEIKANLFKSFWFIFTTAEIATAIATEDATTTTKETAARRKSTNDEHPLQKA